MVIYLMLVYFYNFMLWLICCQFSLCLGSGYVVFEQICFSVMFLNVVFLIKNVKFLIDQW